jgi:hypothetical protein
MSKTSISLDSPRPRAAPTLPILVPARPYQAPSIFPSGKVVPRRQDTKTVVIRKSDEPNAVWLLPTFETARALSSSLLSALQFPLKLLPSLGEDERDFKMEERRPVNTAVSKINASVTRCSPMSHTASVLPRPRPASSSQATPSAHHGIKPIRPAVRDKRPSYPNAPLSHCILSSPSLSSKADATKQQVAISVVAERKRRVSVCDARTPLMPSKPLLVHPTQAHSASLLLRKEPK